MELTLSIYHIMEFTRQLAQKMELEYPAFFFFFWNLIVFKNEYLLGNWDFIIKYYTLYKFSTTIET